MTAVFATIVIFMESKCGADSSSINSSRKLLLKFYMSFKTLSFSNVINNKIKRLAVRTALMDEFIAYKLQK